MPIRISDPFRDPTLNLRPEVNPFLSKMREALDGSSELPLLYGPALKPWAKNWRQWFFEQKQLKVQQLVVEIGCHKGEVLKNMASNHPDKGFIGLDITFKRVVTTANKAVESGQNNMLSLLCNAQALDLLFDSEEVDGFVIFFPDPWARKKRQQKNRLLDLSFLKKLHGCLKTGGFLWIKTDHLSYFEDICQHAAQVGLQKFVPESTDIPGEIYTSRFEAHFRELGEPSYESCWHKPKPASKSPEAET